VGRTSPSDHADHPALDGRELPQDLHHLVEGVGGEAAEAFVDGERAQLHGAAGALRGLGEAEGEREARLEALAAGELRRRPWPGVDTRGVVTRRNM
jgi:hypothetical protein